MGSLNRPHERAASGALVNRLTLNGLPAVLAMRPHLNTKLTLVLCHLVECVFFAHDMLQKMNVHTHHINVMDTVADSTKPPITNSLSLRFISSPSNTGK
jgi:hypothetical protein